MSREEDRAFASMEALLGKVRGRDDYEGWHLLEMLEEHARMFPRAYRRRWLPRLRAQREAYWARSLRRFESLEELERWHALVPVGRF